MRYDAGPGIRSEADVRTLADFFRPRRGAARGFRFRDPFDASSAVDGGLPCAGEQMLGTGNGARPAVCALAAGDLLRRGPGWRWCGWPMARGCDSMVRYGPGQQRSSPHLAARQSTAKRVAH